jgi:hypothetical protein
MTFKKYPLKVQIILALIFIPLNYSVAFLCNNVLHLPFFMDMIFVYAASFFGMPCGFIVGCAHSFIEAIFCQHNLLHAIYAICCITGVLFTRLLITRHKNFEALTVFWSRMGLLIFLSTIVISLEGSLIYAIFFTDIIGTNENTTVLFLAYTLIQQGLGIQFSAFLARLPVNLFDKTIAVCGGYGSYLILQKIINRRTEKTKI